MPKTLLSAWLAAILKVFLVELKGKERRGWRKGRSWMDEAASNKKGAG
jgi:hypothetical protein